MSKASLGWQVTQLYGMTETSPFILVCEPREQHASLTPSQRAAIKARQGVELVTSGELRVVDVDGREVPHDGQTFGEIVARGNVIMKGYFEDPAATAEALARRLDAYRRRRRSPSRWLRRNPRPFQGCNHQRRRKHFVGRNRSHAAHAIHAIQEAAVVGIPHEKWGEAPHAFVVLKAGAAATEDELKQFARANMAHFKVPDGFTILPELPKTATGKIQKYVLRRGRAAIARQ